MLCVYVSLQQSKYTVDPLYMVPCFDLFTVVGLCNACSMQCNACVCPCYPRQYSVQCLPPAAPTSPWSPPHPRESCVVHLVRGPYFERGLESIENIENRLGCNYVYKIVLDSLQLTQLTFRATCITKSLLVTK